MDRALVSLLVSAAILLDVVTTPYLFMHVYNMLVPRAFGLRHMKYDASFILWWALRAISDSSVPLLLTNMNVYYQTQASKAKADGP
jgi:hypothetical protein